VNDCGVDAMTRLDGITASHENVEFVGVFLHSHG
jgi:hypothetical protein